MRRALFCGSIGVSSSFPAAFEINMPTVVYPPLLDRTKLPGRANGANSATALYLSVVVHARFCSHTIEVAVVLTKQQ